MVALIAAACTSTDDSTPEAPALRAAQPGGPLLRFVQQKCSGACVGGINLPVVELAVYDGGRSIMAQAGPWGESWTMHEGTLNPTEIADALELARTVFTGPGDLRTATGGVPADSGTETLTGWSGEQVLTVNIPVREMARSYEGSPDAARRDALNRLIALVTGAIVARGQPYRAPTIAVFTTPAPPVKILPRPWPGPALASFGSPVEADVGPPETRCGLVTYNDDPSTVVALGGDQSAFWSSEGTVFQVVVRSLLPGEATCEDATAA